MIEFRPMRDDEFSDWLAYFLPDYATEIAANYNLSPEAAMAQAKREIANDLPDGPGSPGQTMLCILNDAQDASGVSDAPIGYMWFKENLENRSVFINDFHILPAHQGKGYGKLALAQFEIEMAKAGFEHLRLRVAANNPRALHVYETGGFSPTGINMSKRIGER